MSQSNRSPSIAAVGRGRRFYLISPHSRHTATTAVSLSFRKSRPQTIRHRPLTLSLGVNNPGASGRPGMPPLCPPPLRSDIGKISSSTLGPVKPRLHVAARRADFRCLRSQRARRCIDAALRSVPVRLQGAADREDGRQELYRVAFIAFTAEPLRQHRLAFGAFNCRVAEAQA